MIPVTVECSHSYTAATCTKPKTCKRCGITSGSKLGHKYDNNCDAYCNTCGEKRSVSGHVYSYACDKNCNICGATRSVDVDDHNFYTEIAGEPTCCEYGKKYHICSYCGYSMSEPILPTGKHVYTNACDETCNVCRMTRPISHNYAAATCTKPKTCKICGATSGSALGHKYDNDCDKYCNTCGVGRSITHSYSAATCTKPKTCKICGTTSGSALGHQYDHACDAYCNTCGVPREVNGHKWENGTCSVCGTISPSKVVITTQPKTGYAKINATVKASVKASGEGLKYQWYIKNANGTKYSKSSITKSTYSTAMSSKSKGRRVYCVITDKYGNKVQTKTVILRESVSIIIEPKLSTYAKNGATAKVAVKASGDGLKYTWYVKNAGSSKYTKSSITKATYSVKMSSKVNGRRLYCIVTDKYGNKVQTQTVILKKK